MDDTKAKEAAEALAKVMEADVLCVNGDIHQVGSRKFLKTVCPRRRRPNVILSLVTPGGDPDSAFKMGRCLQNSYGRVIILVPGWCKSAGTLVAIAAHELIIADGGELGPLDIQIAKSDEIMEAGSGLTLDAAMKSLEASASKMVLNIMLSIRRDTGGSITTRTAADLAAKMATGLFEPIYRQIDPIKIGENSRAMNITRGYAQRLNLHSRNLRTPQSLEFLVSSYPDHSFVIDRKEAEIIFSRVSEPTPAVRSFIDALGDDALIPTQRDQPYMEYLSSEPPPESSRSTPDVSLGPTVPPKSRPSKRRANGPSAPAGAGTRGARSNGSPKSDAGAA